MPNRILLSVSAGAGLYPAGLGAALQLHHHLRTTYPEMTIDYAGISSGAVVAVILHRLVNTHESIPSPEAVMEVWERICGSFRGRETIITHLWTAARRFLESYLHPNDYRALSGRLHIGITVYTPLPEFRIISEFHSNADLIDAILTSCTIFPFVPFPFRRFRGLVANDGVHVRTYITLPSHHNYVIRYPRLRRADNNRLILSLFDWLPSRSVEKHRRLYADGAMAVRQRLETHDSDDIPQDVMDPLCGSTRRCTAEYFAVAHQQRPPNWWRVLRFIIVMVATWIAIRQLHRYIGQRGVHLLDGVQIIRWMLRYFYLKYQLGLSIR